jgi:hypothetical protein
MDSSIGLFVYLTVTSSHLDKNSSFASAPIPGASLILNLYPANAGVCKVAEFTGIHIVKLNVRAGVYKMQLAAEGYAAFQHTAHHTGDAAFGAGIMDLFSFGNTAGFGHFDVYVMAAAAFYLLAGIMVDVNAFIGHNFYGR